MATFNEKHLGRKIKNRRFRLGLTQQEAADAYGCSLRWWQSLESGRNVTLHILYQIAAVLKMNAWQLIN